jgi:hypothetical protein
MHSQLVKLGGNFMGKMQGLSWINVDIQRS